MIQFGQAQAKVQCVRPKCSSIGIVHTEIDATKQNFNGYEAIIGRDLPQDLVIVLDFKNEMIIWGNGEILMKP